MSYDNLIHKMAKRSSWAVKEDADPNKWPILTNPYVPKNSQPNWTPQFSNSWGKPINSWGSASIYTSAPSTISHGIMTEEDLQKKKVTIKKYRSIDDPWEVSTWTQSNEG